MFYDPPWSKLGMSVALADQAITELVPHAPLEKGKKHATKKFSDVSHPWFAVFLLILLLWLSTVPSVELSNMYEPAESRKA
jgi:hypothetical protein